MIDKQDKMKETPSTEDLEKNEPEEPDKDNFNALFSFKPNPSSENEEKKQEPLDIFTQSQLWTRSNGSPGLNFNGNTNNQTPKLMHINSFDSLPMPKANPPYTKSPFGGNLSQSNSLTNIPQIPSTGSIPHMNPYSQPFNPNSSAFVPSGNLNSFSKPLLNPRFASTPELTIPSHNNYRMNGDFNEDMNNMTNQNVIDMIENDIRNKIMGKVQNDDFNQHPGFLNGHGNQGNPNFPDVSQFGNLDPNSLSQMNKSALIQLYNNLSMILGKGIC
jgi:hypothetical protein